MRIRNVKGARECVASHKKVVQAPAENKGKWRDFFGNDNPIYIEIGMGKGQFITTHARNNPNINYIGIEYMTNVLYKALDKVDLCEEVDNLYLIRMSADDLKETFEEDEVNRIYLNFSDPWPKVKHAKKRLTNRRYLERYEYILKQGHKIIFKTDNRPLFDYSVEEMKAYGLKLLKVTYDLHDSDHLEGNVMTEYEQKFIAKNTAICMLEAITKP